MPGMKSRIYLPFSIAAVCIAAFALVFCRKAEVDEGKPHPATKPGSLSKPDSLAGRQKPETPRQIGEKTPRPEPDLEPEKVLTPAEEEKAAAKKASTMYKWMLAYCLDHGGAFPPDTSALMTTDLGFPTDQAGDWLRHVIDYRGRDLTTSDDGNFLLLRYRIGNRTDKEIRVTVSGRTIVVPADEPIPEDGPLPGEAPR